MSKLIDVEMPAFSKCFLFSFFPSQKWTFMIVVQIQQNA